MAVKLVKNLESPVKVVLFPFEPAPPPAPIDIGKVPGTKGNPGISISPPAPPAPVAPPAPPATNKMSAVVTPLATSKVPELLKT
jgi:protein TonB